MTIGSDGVVAMIAPLILLELCSGRWHSLSLPEASSGRIVAAHIRASGGEFKSLQTAVRLIASVPE
jgi:hypothetical protein